jgi:tetratricopeptide (TPR) repeat protein
VLNKNKIIAGAQKYIQQGKYDKAIRELNKLVEEDPRDVRTLLKIGDLYSKKGDRDEATDVYRRVAEFYSEQGFFLKAVAVYKQILKYDPSNLTMTLKLAELYEHLGLTQEAMAQYQAIASLHEQTGATRESLEVLRRMVELDSANIAARVRLAEAYSRENMVAEAVGEFERAAEALKAANRLADYVKVAERLVYHAPDRIELVKELARMYLARADTKRALAKLQIAFKTHPQDLEVLTMLAASFRELGQLPKTVFVYRELAKAHQDRGRTDEARAVFRQILELVPGDPAASAALGLAAPMPGGAPLNLGLSGIDSEPGTPAPGFTPPPARVGSAPDRAPAPAAPTRSPPRPAARARPVPEPSEEIKKLLTETDVYVKYGLRDKAVEHLRRILDEAPRCVAAYEKMRDIYLKANDNPRAADALGHIVRIYAVAGDTERQEHARQALAQLAPNHPAALPGAVFSADDGDDALEDIDIDMSTGGFGDDEDDDAPEPAVMDEDVDAAFDASFSTGDIEVDDVMAEPEVFAVGAAGTEDVPSAFADADDDDDDDGDPLGSYDPGVISFGGNAKAAAGRASRASVEALIASSTGSRDRPMTMEMPILNLPSELAAKPDAALEEDLDSAEFFAQQGLIDDAKETVRDVLQRRPGYARAVDMLARLDLEHGGGARDTKPSAKPTIDHALDAAEGAIDALGGDAPSSGPRNADFQPDENDPHYRFDLGIAYRDMGMFDEAIFEFQEASQDPEHTVRAYHQIGQCLVSKGDTNGAVGYFFMALESGADAKMATELKYGIGKAYDTAGDVDNALFWYGDAAREDPSFRDVRDRIRALGGAPPEAVNR